MTFFRNRPDVAEDNPSALRAAPAGVRARRDRRSRARAAAPRPARGARGLRPRRRGDGDDAGVDRRLVARARRRRATARGSSRATSRCDLAFARARSRCCPGRRRVLAQGAAPAAGELLLQPAAARRRRDRSRSTARARARHRPRVARSRVVERGDGAGCRRLGLDRHQSRRRRRADGVPHARPRRRRRSGPAARCATPDGAAEHPRARRRCASSRGAAGRSPRTRVAYPVEFALRAGGVECTVWRRCSTTRSSMRAHRPAPSTGRARCAVAEGGRRVGTGLPRAHRLRCAAQAVSRGWPRAGIVRAARDRRDALDWPPFEEPSHDHPVCRSRPVSWRPLGAHLRRRLAQRADRPRRRRRLEGDLFDRLDRGLRDDRVGVRPGAAGTGRPVASAACGRGTPRRC